MALREKVTQEEEKRTAAQKAEEAAAPETGTVEVVENEGGE